MKVHVIVNPLRPKAIQEVLKQQGIKDFALWEGIYNLETVEKCINLSHKRIIRYAMDNDHPEIAIWEDDCYFEAPDGWQYFLGLKPAEYDLYLAGAYGLPAEYYQKQNAGLHLIDTPFAGLHCYIVHRRFYSKYLQCPDDGHIDTFLSEIKEGKYFICYPFAALQKPGWSSVNKKNVDYNPNLLKHIYHGTEK